MLNILWILTFLSVLVRLNMGIEPRCNDYEAGVLTIEMCRIGNFPDNQISSQKLKPNILTPASDTHYLKWNLIGKFVHYWLAYRWTGFSYSAIPLLSQATNSRYCFYALTIEDNNNYYKNIDVFSILSNQLNLHKLISKSCQSCILINKEPAQILFNVFLDLSIRALWQFCYLLPPLFEKPSVYYRTF